ncbi:hypothetical protein GCM10022267_84930 [Lentzea roselyniae]|uniref:Membrane transport protein MMPL domain-containing protein n=1 Tax=Lentzea roselyniae TaxID=531940 RepID=A0ABP7CE17_9PSEU
MTTTTRRTPRKDPQPSDALTRLGATVIRHRRGVYASWLLAMVLGLALVPHLLSSLTSPAAHVVGSESQRAADVLAAELPSLGNEMLLTVVHSDSLKNTDPAFRAAVQAIETTLTADTGISSVLRLPVAGDPTPPPVLANVLEPFQGEFTDEHTAYLVAGLSGDSRERQDRVPAQRAAADEAASRASGGAVHAYFVGLSAYAQAAQEAEIADLLRVELVAVPVAILVLLLGLRAPVTALLPVGVAGAGVLTTLGVFGLFAGVFPVDGMLLVGVSTIGLGAGIDYALFVVGRYREELARGAPPEQAVAVALATSGRTVAYSGLIVCLTAGALLPVRWPVFQQTAIGLATVVAVVLAATVTLLPAALVSLTPWLQWRAWGSADTRATSGGRWLDRWTRHLMRRPWPYAIGVTAGLLVLAAPVHDLKFGFNLERAALAHTAYGKGLAIQEPDAPGVTGTLQIVVQRPLSSPEPDTGPMLAALRADPMISLATKLDNGRNTTVVLAVPRESTDSPRIVELGKRVREDIVPRTAPAGHTVLVGGTTAVLTDIVAEMWVATWWVVGAVLALMFLLLVVMLRSLLLPLKAITMNLLATGAAFGLAVWLFQEAMGGTTWPQVPILAFTFVFALSMDYQMFLVRRIQEEYRRCGDNSEAVAAGLRHTARTIALAAVILAVAFGSLLFARITGLQVLGFTVAAALIIDATVIRLVLAPALMRLLGRWNWWFPTMR